MKVALVHEWLVDRAGSEKVLEAMASHWPEAPIHTLLHRAGRLGDSPLASHPIHTSFLQRFAALAGTSGGRGLMLPLMPLAVEQFDLAGYELVISSNHAVAKGVLTTADQLHVSYVHTPMRYAWDLYHTYLRSLPWLTRPAVAAILHYLRFWDRAAAERVDRFIANSRTVARRIRKVYDREAEVIHPPVDVDRFASGGGSSEPRGEHYVTLTRLVPYKRVDLIVEAFNRLGLPLTVIGEGPQREALAYRAKPNVRFVGELSDAEVVWWLRSARGFVFAAEEDFGIAPVEAMAAGTAVIALGRAGTGETVVDGVTGLHFHAQRADALQAAVSRFEAEHAPGRPHALSHDRIVEHAQRYGRARFDEQFTHFIERALHDHRHRHRDTHTHAH